MEDIYYIIGTAYAGKSTMVKLLAEKHDERSFRTSGITVYGSWKCGRDIYGSQCLDGNPEGYRNHKR